MSYDVMISSIQKYTANVERLLQMTGGRLRDCVTLETGITGKAYKVREQIGAVRPTKNLSRHADTPLISTPHDARWLYPNDYDWADLVDDQDKLRLMIDPTVYYAQNAVEAMRRAQDEEILMAFYSAARTGENGTTSTAFPTGTQQVAVGVGSSSATGLNVEKLKQARRLLMAAGVDLQSDPIYCAVTAADHDRLLGEIQIANTDFNNTPVLVDGMVSRFLGINFVHVEFTDATAYGAAAVAGGTGSLVNSTSQRLVPVWAKSGIILGTWNDLVVDVSKRPDKRNATQVMVTGTYGATRLQERKVVQIVCA